MLEQLHSWTGVLPAFFAHFVGLAAFIVVIGVMVWRDERDRPED